MPIFTDQKTFENTVIVRDEADFPPINGSNQHPLAAGITYFIDGAVSVANNFLIPASGASQIVSNGTGNTLTYTGGGTMFVQTSLTDGVFAMWDCGFDGNSTATLFNLNDSGAGTFFETHCDVLNFADLGDMDISSASFNFSSWLDFDVGLTLTVASDGLSNTVIYSPSTNTDVFDLTLASGAIFQMINNTPLLSAGDNFVKVNSNANTYRMAVSANLITPSTGELFSSSGDDSTDPRITALDNAGFADSATIGSFSMEGNATATTITLQANDTAITAFADSGTEPGVKTTVTAAGNTVSNGETITITGTTNYNGTWTVSNDAGNSFDINKVFVSDDATGTVEEGWVKVAGTTVEGIVERCSMTGNNELTYTNLDPKKGVISASISATAGGGGGISFTFGVFQNGTRLAGSTTTRDLTNRTGAMGVNAPLLISENDVIEVRTRNNDGTDNPTISSLSVIAP